MCHARLLFLKFKSILTSCLKFVHSFSLPLKYADTFSLHVRPCLGSSSVVLTPVCRDHLVKGMGGLLRCILLGLTSNYSSSAGLGWLPGVCIPNMTFNFNLAEVLALSLPYLISQKVSPFSLPIVFIPQSGQFSPALKTSSRCHSSSLSRYSFLPSLPSRCSITIEHSWLPGMRSIPCLASVHMCVTPSRHGM